MRDAFIDELTQLARQDSRIILIVGDLGYGVVDRFATEMPEQFINAGVAEQNMMGMAAGLASRGYQVFVYSIANFPTMRCLEQIRNDVCYHGFNVNIVSVGAGTAYGTLGYTHHAIEDIAVMRALPGLRILSPADPIEARMAARVATETDGPNYIRLGKNGEPVLHGVGSKALTTLEFPIQLREGHDAVILATGAIAGEAMIAADLLVENGYEVRVMSCPTIKPMNLDWLTKIGCSGPVVTLEDHSRTGGFGSAVLEYCNDAKLDTYVVRLGIDPEQIKAIGDSSYLRKLHGIDAQAIRKVILSLLS